MRGHGAVSAFLFVLAMLLGAPIVAADDAEFASAAGDDAVQSRRPAVAIALYRRAQRLGFRDTVSLDARIAGAEAQRRSFLSVCETKLGAAGRHACVAARLPGAADEFIVLRRLGIIDESDHENSSALESYISADRLQPGDPNIAAAILRLSATVARTDAAAQRVPGQIPLQLQGTPSTLESAYYLQAGEHRFSNAEPATFSH